MYIYINDFALVCASNKSKSSKKTPFDISSFRPDPREFLEKNKMYPATAVFENVNIGIRKPCMYKALRSISILENKSVFYRIR